MRAMFVTDGIVARTAVRNSVGEQQIDKGVQPTAGLFELTNTSGTLSPELYVISPRLVDMCTKSRVAQGPYGPYEGEMLGHVIVYFLHSIRRRNLGSWHFIKYLFYVCYIEKEHWSQTFQTYMYFSTPRAVHFLES